MTKVININTERHYREACDYFYFLQNTKFAFLCLEKALSITPKHHRAWFLKGEMFLNGNDIERAVECFEKVENYNKNDAKNLANIAVCYEMLEDYKSALNYSNKALECIAEEDCELLPSLYELQISSLIKLKHHFEAARALKKYNSYLFLEDVHRLKTSLNDSMKTMALSF